MFYATQHRTSSSDVSEADTVCWLTLCLSDHSWSQMLFFVFFITTEVRYLIISVSIHNPCVDGFVATGGQ